MKNNFDENGFALKDVRVKVYQYDDHDNEYTGTKYEHVVYGTGIPALSTLIEPNSDKDGFTQVFNEEQQSWEYVEDHRYEDVYNIHTKQKEDIRYIGALKEEHTKIAPPSIEHDFIDGEWVITEEKQAHIDEMNNQQRIYELEAEKAELSTSMMKNSLLGKTEEAKADAIRIEEIEAEIEQLKE